MIRDVNSSWEGDGAKGAGTWWCHFGYLNNLAGPTLAKHCSICRGSCSICLLMSTVAGGTHVYHVMSRAGSTFTWRSDHRGKWQLLWQMFSLSWEESHGTPVQSEGLDESLATTATACLPECTTTLHRKQGEEQGVRPFLTTASNRTRKGPHWVLKCGNKSGKDLVFSKYLLYPIQKGNKYRILLLCLFIWNFQFCLNEELPMFYTLKTIGYFVDPISGLFVLTCIFG